MTEPNCIECLNSTSCDEEIRPCVRFVLRYQEAEVEHQPAAVCAFRMCSHPGKCAWQKLDHGVKTCVLPENARWTMRDDLKLFNDALLQCCDSTSCPCCGCDLSTDTAAHDDKTDKHEEGCLWTQVLARLKP